MFKVEESLARLNTRFYNVDMSITFDPESDSIVTLFRGTEQATGLRMISRMLTHSSKVFKLDMDMTVAVAHMMALESQ
jgi:hypothetical protein